VFVQVGEGIEGLVHISEIAAHHVESPDQVVAVGEELWVKIIELDTQRRRISLSIKGAADGGEVSEEYREAFGSHAYDAEGNYIGGINYGEFTPETEAQAAWAEFAAATASSTLPAAALVTTSPVSGWTRLKVAPDLAATVTLSMINSDFIFFLRVD
jgi:small subunit ribosomal protein S1